MVVEARGAVKAGYFERLTSTVCRRAFSSPEAIGYEGLISSAALQALAPFFDENVTGTRILDVGCGGGRLAAHLARRSQAVVVGIDPSRSQVRRLARRARSADSAWPTMASANALPFRGGVFDSVISSCAFKHWPRPSRRPARVRAFAPLRREARSSPRSTAVAPARKSGGSRAHASAARLERGIRSVCDADSRWCGPQHRTSRQRLCRSGFASPDRYEGRRYALHFHDLRHVANTLTAASGASIRELMHRMGHVSPAAAMRYQHATKDRDAAIVAAPGELIAPKSASVTELQPAAGDRD